MQSRSLSDNFEFAKDAWSFVHDGSSLLLFKSNSFNLVMTDGFSVFMLIDSVRDIVCSISLVGFWWKKDIE